jgi:hypothetical protein
MHTRLRRPFQKPTSSRSAADHRTATQGKPASLSAHSVVWKQTIKTRNQSHPARVARNQTHNPFPERARNPYRKSGAPRPNPIHPLPSLDRTLTRHPPTPTLMQAPLKTFFRAQPGAKST